MAQICHNPYWENREIKSICRQLPTTNEVAAGLGSVSNFFIRVLLKEAKDF